MKKKNCENCKNLKQIKYVEEGCFIVEQFCTKGNNETICNSQNKVCNEWEENMI